MKNLLSVCGQQRRWVNWKKIQKNGKETKPPINPRTGGAASNSDPTTWSTYDKALDRSGNIGIMFGLEKEYGGYYICGVDLDGCLHSGRLEPEAREVVDKFKCYTEVSPSGTGVHLVFKANKEHVDKLRKKFDVTHWVKFSGSDDRKHEMALHLSHSFFTVTGEEFNDNDMEDIVGYDVLAWFMSSAGPQFQARYSKGKKAEYKRDESGSGWGFRFFKQCYKDGQNREVAIAQIKKDKGRAGEWARRSDQRELERGWEIGVKMVEEPWEVGVGAPPLIGRLASSITPRDAKFIWYPYILEGGICICASPGGTGKGLWATDLVARETTGMRFPESKDKGHKRKVLWYEVEDVVDTTLVPRLEAAGADLSKVEIFEGSEPSLTSLTRDKIMDENVGLIVLSPLLRYLGVENPNDVNGAYGSLEKLSDKIRDLPCTIVGLMHPNKKVDMPAVERILGSVAFPSFVRSVILLRPEEDEGVVRMVHGKHNNSVKGDDLLFEKINTKGVHHRGQYIKLEWEKAEENIKTDDAFDKSKKPGEKKDDSWSWLREQLKDYKWHKRRDVINAGEGYGHSEKAIHKAVTRHRDEIESRSEGFGVEKTGFWRLKVNGVAVK